MQNNIPNNVPSVLVINFREMSLKDKLIFVYKHMAVGKYKAFVN